MGKLFGKLTYGNEWLIIYCISTLSISIAWYIMEFLEFGMLMESHTDSVIGIAFAITLTELLMARRESKNEN